MLVRVQVEVGLVPGFDQKLAENTFVRNYGNDTQLVVLLLLTEIDSLALAKAARSLVKAECLEMVDNEANVLHPIRAASRTQQILEGADLCFKIFWIAV